MALSPKVQEVVDAIAETIKEFKEIPSGHLYANLMGYMDLNTYQTLIKYMELKDWIKIEYNLITWIKD
jgi:hypothetical protein